MSNAFIAQIFNVHFSDQLKKVKLFLAVKKASVNERANVVYWYSLLFIYNINFVNYSV